VLVVFVVAILTVGRERLFEMLSETDGSSLPLRPDRGAWFPWRYPDGAENADFPEVFFKTPQP
jgi:hypothetical protein